MQQAFKSIKNWNYLQPGKEIEWLTITQDFLKGFPLKKNQHIQCYNCKGRGHTMKNCPYSPRVIMREHRGLTTELKMLLHPNLELMIVQTPYQTLTIKND